MIMKTNYPLFAAAMVAVFLGAGLAGVLLDGQSLRAEDSGPSYGQGRGMGYGGGQGMGMMRNADPLPVTEEEAIAPVEDMRLFVPMPPEARQIMREQMKGFLAALAQIQGYLVEGKLEEAADLAETQMGRTERGKHRGMGPGRYMPVSMRTLAWNMHDQASTFAEVADGGDLIASYKALQQVQNSCVACHFSYRTR